MAETNHNTITAAETTINAWAIYSTRTGRLTRIVEPNPEGDGPCVRLDPTEHYARPVQVALAPGETWEETIYGSMAVYASSPVTRRVEGYDLDDARVLGLARIVD